MVAAVDSATLEANIRCAGGMIGAMQWLPPQGITKWLTEGIFSPLFNPVSPEASDGSLLNFQFTRERDERVYEKRWRGHEEGRTDTTGTEEQHK